jgi:hypothetical protein
VRAAQRHELRGSGLEADDEMGFIPWELHLTLTVRTG